MPSAMLSLILTKPMFWKMRVFFVGQYTNAFMCRQLVQCTPILFLKNWIKMIYFAFWWVSFNSCWMKMDPGHKVSEFYKYMSSYFVTLVTRSYLCQQKVKILIDYIIYNIFWFHLILGRVAHGWSHLIKPRRALIT